MINNTWSSWCNANTSFCNSSCLYAVKIHDIHLIGTHLFHCLVKGDNCLKMAQPIFLPFTPNYPYKCSVLPRFQARKSLITTRLIAHPWRKIIQWLQFYLHQYLYSKCLNNRCTFFNISGSKLFDPLTVQVWLLFAYTSAHFDFLIYMEAACGYMKPDKMRTGYWKDCIFAKKLNIHTRFLLKTSTHKKVNMSSATRG